MSADGSLAQGRNNLVKDPPLATQARVEKQRREFIEAVSLRGTLTTSGASACHAEPSQAYAAKRSVGNLARSGSPKSARHQLLPTQERYGSMSPFPDGPTPAVHRSPFQVSTSTLFSATSLPVAMQSEAERQFMVSRSPEFEWSSTFFSGTGSASEDHDRPFHVSMGVIVVH
jgi:hypothetical protein